MANDPGLGALRWVGAEVPEVTHDVGETADGEVVLLHGLPLPHLVDHTVTLGAATDLGFFVQLFTPVAGRNH